MIFKSNKVIQQYNNAQILRFNYSVSRWTTKMHSENKNCTILIHKGNLYCRRKISARGPRFKVSSEGLLAEIGIPLQSPIQVETKTDVVTLAY